MNKYLKQKLLKKKSDGTGESEVEKSKVLTGNQRRKYKKNQRKIKKGKGSRPAF